MLVKELGKKKFWNVAPVWGKAAVGGGGGGLSWTPTDLKTDPAAGFVASKTFTGVSIGAASATRQVIVGLMNTAGGGTTNYTCTIDSGGGPVTATRHSQAESSVGGAGVALFQLNVATGTTATIVITSSVAGDIHVIAIGVGALNGVNGTPTAIATAGIYPASGGFPYPTGSSITVPSSGIAIGVAGCATAPGTPGWNNIAADASLTGIIGATSSALTMGNIITPGPIAPASVFGNFAQCVTLAAAWGP